METVDDVLRHFGVKGMKWGVRKSDVNRIGSLAKPVSGLGAGRSQTKLAFKAHVKNSGGLHKVSDKELQAMLNRLDMERKYTKIVNEDAAKRAKGAQALGHVLLEVGKIAVPIAIGVAAKSAADRGTFRTTALTVRKAIGN